MGWMFLEVTAALAIAVGLVWWTIPRKPKTKEGAGNPAGKDPPPGG
ncbi:MAG: hypothetical protein IPP91_16350 [Betaproteobacteria bacterium]|nr:hypothetical protein [Betaproteobacteria bacterium]